MNIINQKLSRQQFTDYVNSKNFGSEPPNKLVIHHTWSPKKDQWHGESTIMGLKNYYEGLGWSAGPHLFVAEDGIWLFSDMRYDGIHAGSGNHLSIGIEVVGDYDNEVWSGETKTNTLHAIKTLLEKLNIPDSEIHFHRDYSTKTCPGTAITKPWVKSELDKYRQQTNNTTTVASNNNNTNTNMSNNSGTVDEGDLVKSPNDPKVYLIENNKKRHVQNELAFWLLTDSELKSTKIVNQIVLDTIPEGTEINVNDFDPALLRVIKHMSKMYKNNPTYAQKLFSTVL